MAVAGVRMTDSANPKAAIFGCEGPVLSADEESFFRSADPLGFILFARNCESPDQLRDLTSALRASIGREDAPILVDQEGGRVARLKPPQWRAAPPPGLFGRLASHDWERAAEALRINTELLAIELSDVGIDVDCIPMLDLQFPGASDVIGNRSFGGDPKLVAGLGKIVCDTLLARGVMPVIKHMPGHGRARVDSHKELPVVGTALPELCASDFVPFESLADAPWGMTAHVVFTDLDPDQPATTSSKVIAEVIRGSIGFQGLLLSDDLSMEALQGSLAERADRALQAGCDIALHCNGKAEEMIPIAEVAPAMTPLAMRRFALARTRLQQPAEVDSELLQRRLELLVNVG